MRLALGEAEVSTIRHHNTVEVAMPLSLSRQLAVFGALAFLPLPLAAQVRADVNVHIGSRPRPEVVVVRRAPARRVVAPRVIVVDRIHERGRGVRSAKWWRKHGYRPMQVYYSDGRYYDRRFDSRSSVRVVVVYERDGRYYRDWDDRYDRNDGYYRDDHRDRDDGYYRDDRYDR
jgi:hypothetical protein